MYDANSASSPVLVLRYDYDICLLVLLKCIAIYSLPNRRNHPQHWMAFRWWFLL